jgi:predicted transcriptional regulator
MQKLGNQKSRNTTVSLSGEMYARLVKEADALRRAKGWVIREALDEYFRRHAQVEKAGK